MNYRLRGQYSTNPDVALKQILIDRGVEDIEKFLNPTSQCELNPYDLDNIEIAAELLLKHLKNNNKICIVCDPDVDGITSSSIIWLYIKNIFPNADLTFTLHDGKQHGLDDKIDWLIDNNKQFNLILVPDAGSYDIEYHKRLKDSGIDCLVIDHHAVLIDKNGEMILPNQDYAIVVNNQLSLNYSNKFLCGAGMAYKFCEVLDDKLGIDCAREYLDLVALGEIADVMDKTNSETNYLMTEGLKHIKNKGLKTLIEAQSYTLKEKSIYPYPGLTTTDVAFYIAPLINSIIRVGTLQEKEAIFYCFIEPDKLLKSTKRGAKENDTETAAEQAARVGKNAKARQDKLKEKAIDLIDFKIQKNELANNNIIIVELEPEDEIPSEINGLVAMGIVNKYNKPCLIVRRNEDNLLQGSARNNGNFSALPDLKQYLGNSGFFEYVAGHNNAFGAGISVNKLSSFINYINKDLPTNAFDKCYVVDYALKATDNNTDLMFNLFSHPEFFGNQIEEIKIIVLDIPLSNVTIMGQNKDCIKISYNNIDYIKFKDSDFVQEILSNRMSKLTVYGRGNINEFMGKTSIQFFIDDYELEEDIHRYDF